MALNIWAIGLLKKCQKCGREFLVENFLFGTNHTADIGVVCWDCLSEEDRQTARERYKLS